jgi:phospholipid transport system substrate-binding protein
MKRTSIVIGLVVMFAATAMAKKAADPIALLKIKYAQMKKIIKKYPDQWVMRDHIREVMETFVDYEELSRLTLPGTWEKLNKKQRKEFVDQFKQMIQRTYVNKFNANRKFSITYNGKVRYDDKGRAFVSTTIHSGRSEAQVDYAFRKKKGHWWAYDVIIDEISLMRKYRRQFTRIVKRDGFDTLLAKIRKRNLRRKQEEDRDRAQAKVEKSEPVQSESVQSDH